MRISLDRINLKADSSKGKEAKPGRGEREGGRGG